MRTFKYRGAMYHQAPIRTAREAGQDQWERFQAAIAKAAEQRDETTLKAVKQTLLKLSDVIASGAKDKKNKQAVEAHAAINKLIDATFPTVDTAETEADLQKLLQHVFKIYSYFTNTRVLEPDRQGVGENRLVPASTRHKARGRGPTTPS